MAEWKEITKEEFDAPAEPTNDYQTLLEMWREEKKKRQDAEKELTEVKEDNKKLAKQIEDQRVDQGGWRNR
jgi:DNA repair exonuclease SbcCD ATPase subunit|tara:strand:- start:381 stop:593 length:213 start_codon:yes stop_codon:yes gene_type:complete